MGLDHLGDTPGPCHQIFCPFLFHPADLQAADLLVLKAFPALFAVTLLIGDRPLQPLLFGADLAGVTKYHAQRHNGHFPKVSFPVISASNAAIDQSDHFLLLGLVHLIKFFKHRSFSLSRRLIAVFLLQLGVPPFQHGFQTGLSVAICKNKKLLHQSGE